MSSFRRAVPATGISIPAGTRRWLDGALLVSTGLASLDEAIGGGVPLGSLILVEEDARGGRLAGTLAALFAAEALAAGHDLVVAGADGRGNNPETFIESLPFCSSTGSADAEARASSLAAAAAAESPTEAALDAEPVLDSGEFDDGGAPKPPSLNANSAVLSSGYARAVQAAAAAKDASIDASRRSAKFCHTFDLSRRATPSYVSSLLACNRIRMLRVRVDSTPRVTDDILRSSSIPPHARAVALRMNKADILLHAQNAALRTRQDASREEKEGSLSPLSSLTLTGAVLRSIAVERERSGACPYEDLMAQLRPLLGSEEKPKDPRPAAAAQAPITVSRIVLFGLGGVAWPGCTGADVASLKGCAKDTSRELSGERQHSAAKPLVNFVSLLSAAVSASRATATPAVAIVVLPSWALPKAVSGALRARASLVLKLHGVGDPAYASGRDYSDPLEAAVASKGFAHAAGVLFVRRLPHWGHAAPQTSVSGDEWIVTRERRRIGLEKPHPPPEDAAPDGASLPCSSSGGGKKPIVDF